MIGKAVQARITSDAAIARIVGNRVYRDKAPQTTKLPYIVYVGDDAELDRTYTGPTGLVNQKVTIGCFARERKDSVDLGVKVRALFDIRRRPRQVIEWGGITIQSCFFKGQRDEEDTIDGVGQDFPVYVREIDIDFWFNDPDYIPA